MPREIMIPSVFLPVMKEILHDSAKDTHRYIKGMLALHQQLHFSLINAFQNLTQSTDESMIKIIADHPETHEKLQDQLALSGCTRLDIVIQPGTVEVKYPRYDTRWEYKQVEMYNEVWIKNPSQTPVVIVRIEKESDSPSEILLVRKKDRWSMENWSEILLYPNQHLFKERVNALLTFFDVPRANFEYVVSSFSE